MTNEDLQDIKEQILIEEKNCSTHIILIVCHKESIKNQIVKLPCAALNAMDGYPRNARVMPIGGYVYDGVTDSYIINCVNFLPVGVIPFSYCLKIANTGLWNCFAPIPEKVFRKYLSEERLLRLDNFLAKHAEDDLLFKYIQFIND